MNAVTSAALAVLELVIAIGAGLAILWAAVAGPTLGALVRTVVMVVILGAAMFAVDALEKRRNGGRS